MDTSEHPSATHPWGDAATPFDALGGEPVVRAVVETFYDVVDADAPVLRAMLPNDDSTSRRKLGDYLIEWTGGPALYTPVRGHPRMRMRHMPFVITEADAETWLACMARSLDTNDVDGQVRAFLDDRLSALAMHMVNADSEDPRTEQRRSLGLRSGVDPEVTEDGRAS